MTHSLSDMPTYRTDLVLAATEEFRAIAATMLQYNVSSFFFRRQLADQMQIVLVTADEFGKSENKHEYRRPNTIQNCIIALTCMMLIAMLFIPSPLVVVCVTMSAASINLGESCVLGHNYTSHEQVLWATCRCGIFTSTRSP